MRKSPIARWLALFMGAWLSLVQSDAGLFHACSAGNSAIAMYEMAAETGGSSGSESQTGHGGHSGHDMSSHAVSSHEAPASTSDRASPHPSHHAASPGDHQQRGDHECHCIGHCCATVVPTLITPDAYALGSVVRVASVQPGRASHEVMASWVDFVLPFSTAPPVVA